MLSHTKNIGGMCNNAFLLYSFSHNTELSIAAYYKSAGNFRQHNLMFF